MEKEIIEGNRLIADFYSVGHKKYPNEIVNVMSYGFDPPIDGSQWWHESKLKFHSSWNWIMPVVEKIVSLDIDFCADLLAKSERNYQYNVFIEKANGSSITSVKNIYGETMIITFWKAVIQFIQWYNSHTK